MTPIHIAPLLRSREAALESEGMIRPVNSVGYTAHAAEENAGIKPKLSPVSKTFAINGKLVTAKE